MHTTAAHRIGRPSPPRRSRPPGCCSSAPARRARNDPDTPTQGPITLSPEQATYVCTRRIPAILARIDRVTARIGADVTTRGSTAWLQARQDRAEAAGHGDVADRIQKRIDGRPAKLAALGDAKQRVADFRNANCAS